MQICEILLMDYEIDMMSIKGWRRLSLKARKVIMNRVKSVLAQNFSKSFFLGQKDTISTRASHVVTHRTTSRARTILTSEIGRDRVLYGWYDRSWWFSHLIRHKYHDFILSCIKNDSWILTLEHKTRCGHLPLNIGRDEDTYLWT